MTIATTILTRAPSPQNPIGPARGGRIADSAATATTPSAAQGLRDAPSPAVPASSYRPPPWRAEDGARSNLPSQARVAFRAPSPAAPSLGSNRSQAPSQALQEAVSQPARATAAPTAPAAAAVPGKSPRDGTPRRLRPSESPETGGQAATGAKERATQRGARIGWAGASADSDGGGLRVDARAPPAQGTSSRGGTTRTFSADDGWRGTADALGRLSLSQDSEPQTAAATAQGLARESAVGSPPPLAAAAGRTGAVGDSDAEAEWLVVGAGGVARPHALWGRRGLLAHQDEHEELERKRNEAASERHEAQDQRRRLDAPVKFGSPRRVPPRAPPLQLFPEHSALPLSSCSV
jgi:hypothetical protein